VEAVASLYREPERATELSFGALEFHDVFQIYRSGLAEAVALRGLDLRIERGEVVAIFGPSGSGKSTMLRLAAGLEQPSAGEVRTFGQPLSRLDERGLAHYRAREVALVFQSGNSWPWLTAGENLGTTLRLAGKRSGGDALATFGLAGRARQKTGTLSGGEQQRLAVAACAARRAPLVLADEPTAELDVLNERIVLAELLELREEHGSTVVVVTHSTRVAEIADRVLEIRDGRLA
jgi:putative ABC transport system ATP-binding protein